MRPNESYPAAYYVDVAVCAPLRMLFTYAWPSCLDTPEEGLRVMVPFGRAERMAVVVRVQALAPDYWQQCKAVQDRLDVQPLYDVMRRNWVARLQAYYLAGSGEMHDLAYAWAAHDEKRRFRCLDVKHFGEAHPQWKHVFDSKRALSLHTIVKRSQGAIEAVRYQVLKWQKQSVLEEVSATEQSWDVPAMKGEAAPASLYPAQELAVQSVLQHADTFTPFLLFGATGSGKTEVYLQIAQRLVAQGKQVLILVPEIGLTPMWLARLQTRFDKVLCWHSAMRSADRIAVCDQLATADVVIGTRSALFLPLPRLGFMVVDEEHDASFKQQDGVAYAAREAAMLLTQALQIPLILGSATPSMESWQLVAAGRMQRLDLPVRAAASCRMQVLDMRQQEKGTLLSDALLQSLRDTHARGEQSILFLNRRGYAPALQCTACGDVPQCPHCSLRLTLHRGQRKLRCHACGFYRQVPRVCDACGEDALFPIGAGTEKIEDLLVQALPGVRMARLDRDSIASPQAFHQILHDFSVGNIDCLLGTQMLVKGHHFPKVTLVGVLNADLGLSMPDFRAGERWWQQITQVMGRAGRGDLPAEILIQTHMPDAAWLQKLEQVSAETILSDELALREALQFPPFARWVRVVFSSVHADKALQAAHAFAAQVKDIAGLQVGSALPCPVERVAARYRYEVMLRDHSKRVLPWSLSTCLDHVPVPSQVRRRVDVDPQDLM